MLSQAGRAGWALQVQGFGRAPQARVSVLPPHVAWADTWHCHLGHGGNSRIRLPSLQGTVLSFPLCPSTAEGFRLGTPFLLCSPEMAPRQQGAQEGLGSCLSCRLELVREILQPQERMESTWGPAAP